MHRDITFRELHQTLQVVMGWWNYHLHQFQIGSLTITDPETLAEWDVAGVPDDVARLNEYIQQEGTTFTYEYDFGDGWQHELLLEKILHFREGVYWLSELVMAPLASTQIFTSQASVSAVTAR